MRKILLVVLLIASAAPLRVVVTTCGDKFLLVGRSARFNQAYAAIYPATILLYARSGRPATAAILDPKFQASLTRAGHRVEVAKDESQIEPLLYAGRFDIVLTDVADIDSLRAKAAASPSHPTVMPVLSKLTKEEAQAIKTRYQCELKPSDRPSRYLSTIDDEMQTRIKARAAKKS